jgi:hypothetical protein
VTTRAQRLRTLKAQATRRLGPGDPYVAAVGRRLALAHLVTWLEQARLRDWPEDDYRTVVALVTAARGRGPGVTQGRAPQNGVIGGCDPFAPERVMQARPRFVARLRLKNAHPDHTRITPRGGTAT